MSEATDKTIALNVRLKPSEPSAHPRATNYTNVGVAQGSASVDFGFIAPALLAAIAKTAKDGPAAPKGFGQHARHPRGHGWCCPAERLADGTSCSLASMGACSRSVLGVNGFVQQAPQSSKTFRFLKRPSSSSEWCSRSESINPDTSFSSPRRLIRSSTLQSCLVHSISNWRLRRRPSSRSNTQPALPQWIMSHITRG